MTSVCVQLPYPHSPERGPGWTWVNLREDTDDFDVLREIWVEDVYHLRGLEWRQADEYVQKDGTGKVLANFGPEYRPGGSVIIDLGAHVGLASVLALQLGCRRTVALEPNRQNYAYLAQNLQQFSSRAEIVHGALGDQPVVSQGEGATAHTAPGDGAHYSLARLIRTAAPNIGDRVDLVKCDVEGAEFDAFLACPHETLAKVDRITMEWHGPAECPWLDRPRIGELAEHLGYTHSVTTFGDPSKGGYLHAHAYAQ